MISFDGQSWKEKYDSLINYSVAELVQDQNGKIWVLPETSNHSIKMLPEFGDQFFPPLSEATGSSFRLKKMCFHQNLPVILDSKSRIYFLREGIWSEHKNSDESLIINNIYSAHKILFALTNKGVYKLDDNELIPLSKINSQLPGKNVLTMSSSIADTGNQCWLLSTNWLGYFIKDKFVKVSSDFNLMSYKDQSGTYFISAIQNTVIFGNQVSSFELDKVENKVRKIDFDGTGLGEGGTSVYIDYENNIWITSSRGIYKLYYTPFRNFDSESGLKYNEVTAIEFMGDRYVALGQEFNLALFDIKTNRIKNIEIESKTKGTYIYSRIWDLQYDSRNILWIVDYANGLGNLKKDKTNWIDFKGDELISVIEDSEKNIWIAGAKTVYKYDNGLIPVIDSAKGLNMRKLFPSKSGGFYIATFNRGAGIYKNGSLEFAQGNNKNSNNIYALCESNYNGTLVGSSGGLYKISGNKLKKFSLPGLSINEPIYFIAGGKDKELWFGLGEGVIRWDGNVSFRFTNNNGLLGLEANRDAGKLDGNGNFWIGTEEGLSVYNSAYDLPKTSPPKGEIIFIQTSDNKKYLINNNISLASDQNNISLKVAGYSYIDERNVYYHIKLIYNNNSIIDSFKTDETLIRFPSLSPGDYSVELLIENANGILSDSVYSASFTIASPFYYQAWFYLLVIILLIVIVSAIFRYYNNLKLTERLEKTVRDRTHELHEEIIEKREYEIALKESELRYRSLFQNSLYGIYRETMDGKIILCNPAFLKIFGAKSFDEVKDIDFSDSLYVDPEARNRFFNILKKDEIVDGLEIQYTTLDNREIWVRESARLIKDIGNRFFVEGIIEDVTEKKQAEVKVMEAKEKAEKSDRLKSEFLAQMSHEIRTPVNTILSFSALIRDDLKDRKTDYMNEYFTAIEKGSKRLIRTIDSILNLSQLQLGNYDAKFEKLDLCEIAFGIAEEFKGQAIEKGLEITTSHGSGDCSITGDYYSVTQLIANLVDNAVKYTEKGKIDIFSSVDDDKVIMKITDTGVGMSQDFLNELFEPFSQEETGYTRKYEGTGLGLSLVKKYCDINNAEISVESEKNKGTVFIITFKKDGYST
ncbi:MAG: PAS domain S-box protein [Melioribacteraceae bacterium]|nr:PAS domain S-box protein [Melioribacteraceae bacterium]